MRGKIIRWFGPVHTGLGDCKMPGIFHGEHQAEVEAELMWQDKPLDVIRAKVLGDGIYKGVTIFLHPRQVEVVE